MNLTVYMYGQNWVFDEPGVCEKEAFVYGSSDIITKVATDKGIENAKTRLLDITFDKKPLPEYDCKMEWVKTESNGNWYECKEKGMKGWLCPMLLYYFKTPPKEIYFLVEDGGEAPEIQVPKPEFSVADIALELEEGKIVSWEDLEKEYKNFEEESYDDHEKEEGYNDPFAEFQKVQAFLDSEDDDPYSIH